MQLLPKMAVVVLLTVMCIPAMAQKIKLVDGDPAVIKDEKTLNVEFTYDHLSVGKYSEDDYISKKQPSTTKRSPVKAMPGPKPGRKTGKAGTSLNLIPFSMTTAILKQVNFLMPNTP